MKKKYFLISVMAISLTLNGFSQDCDKYLNQQTKVVNTKGMVVKVLGRTADVVLGTNFSLLTRSIDQLQMLDNMQHQACLKLQTVKNEFARESQEARIEQTLAEMVKLINQSGG